MGEREVTEYIEITEEEELHLCDFCGRDSDTFDGTFNDVELDEATYIDPNSYKHDKEKIKNKATEDDVVPIVEGEFIKEEEFTTENEGELHLCDQCYAAYLEVLEE